MFGYINIHKEELKVKEYYKYKAFYCGLCDQLKKEYGRLGQMTLTYDMTFLIVLLTSLYETSVTQTKGRCLAHPTHTHWKLKNEITNYAADMNIALTYHKLADDWIDDKSYLSKSGMQLFSKKYKRIELQYPRQCEVIQSCLQELHKAEQRNEMNLDVIAKPFGNLMGELFVYRQDQWENTLRNLGFYLGKFIYLLDAYEDIEKDKKKGNYNPFLVSKKELISVEEITQILTMMMGECTREFEKLPLEWDVELLRNILYAGVWKKFENNTLNHDDRGKRI